MRSRYPALGPTELVIEISTYKNDDILPPNMIKNVEDPKA
jgi:hypothetical protein